MKSSLIRYCSSRDPLTRCIDLGTNDPEAPVDYPDYAERLAKYIRTSTKRMYNNRMQEELFGILICSTGIGMSIAANRYPWIRGALCYTEECVRLAREHNNANVLIFGAKITTDEMAHSFLDTFLKTPTSSKERHVNRIKKLTNIDVRRNAHGTVNPVDKKTS